MEDFHRCCTSNVTLPAEALHDTVAQVDSDKLVTNFSEHPLRF